MKWNSTMSAAALLLSLGASACGDDESGDPSSATDETTGAETDGNFTDDPAKTETDETDGDTDPGDDTDSSDPDGNTDSGAPDGNTDSDDGNDVDPTTTFEAESGLFSIEHPTEWTALEHPDGAGVLLANTAEASDRFLSQESLKEEDLIVNVTLMPPETLDALGVPLAPELTDEQLLEMLTGALGVNDSEAAPGVHFAELDSGSAALMTHPDEVGGSIIVALEGFSVAVVSVADGDGVDQDQLEEVADMWANSLEFLGDSEQLLGALLGQ